MSTSKVTEKYIIIGDCRGLTYYLQLKPTKYGHAPEFIWNGLKDNGINLGTLEVANQVMKEMMPYVKINMKVISY